MGLHLRKYSTGLPAWAYIYENIQLECLRYGPTSTKIFDRTAYIGPHPRKYSAGVPTSWAYIYKNIQQDCLHGPTSTKIFNRGAYIWAYIYENIQQGCLHRISQGIFNLD
jgi:hypothetical protein